VAGNAPPPEVEELGLLEVAHSASVRALDIIGHDLQIRFHIYGGARHEEQVSTELPRVSLLRFLLDLHRSVKDTSAAPGRHDAPAPTVSSDQHAASRQTPILVV
jgi:hypothetical protein